MSNDKNDALELAEIFELEPDEDSLYRRAAAAIRYQAAEIEQLKAELQRVYTVVTSHAKITLKAEDERDQLKAKNEKLVDALEELMGWQVKNVTSWSNPAYDHASKALKGGT